MCFYKECDCRTHKIAEDDLECFKVVEKKSDGHWISRYYDFHYKRNERYDEDSDVLMLDKQPSLHGSVFHSYKCFTTAVLREYARFDNCCVIRCIIPKGTPYWENYGEYASMSIIPIGELGELNLKRILGKGPIRFI